MVVHLRREEEVISADDGHAECGRSAEEGAQRVAAARLGWDTCMSSKLPSAYASRAANGGEGVLEGQPRTRMAFDKYGPTHPKWKHRVLCVDLSLEPL